MGKFKFLIKIKRLPKKFYKILVNVLRLFTLEDLFRVKIKGKGY